MGAALAKYNLTANSTGARRMCPIDIGLGLNNVRSCALKTAFRQTANICLVDHQVARLWLRL